VGALFSAIGSFFGVLFSPITTVFHYVFFLPVFNILMLIYQGVHSFGLSIILLTLLIRGALFPLTRKQLASSRKMQELAPKVKALQAQYRGDNAGFVAAQQALYKENGVSMYGGCLPLLIQLPFLYALYYSFYQVLLTRGNVLTAINSLIYPFLPHLTAAPSTTFLGLSLVTPSIPLAIVAGLLTFVQMRMAMPVTAPSTGAQTDQTAAMQRNMQYIMPLITAFFGSRFPAGMALYWTVSTGFSAVQQYFISGWGSLWVGVPGMQRFVPPPKAAPTAITPADTRRGASATSAIPAPAAPSGGFFARLRERLQEIQGEAANRAAADREAAEARRAGVTTTEAGKGKSAVAEQAELEASAQRKAASAPRARTRAKSGVTLVRPVPASAENAAPEKRIAQENGALSVESEDLPEKRIARDASEPGAKGNGAGSSLASAGNGANGAGKQGGQNGVRSGQQSARGRSRGSR
jgi:YidC/Oxa1 family membrane protein insertase